MDVMFIFGLDMPNPGPILSDQCRIFASLFMLKALRSAKECEGWKDRLVPDPGVNSSEGARTI
jgi:hypothetical protein